jgi:hypothetical protein
MRNILLTFSVILTLSCCSDNSTNNRKLNTKIQIFNLIPLALTPATYSTHKYEYFNAELTYQVRNDTIQFCECSRLLDKITVTIHNGGGMYYDELLIEIFEDTFISTFKHIGDVKTMDFNAYPVKQQLKLNKLNARPGDTLTGEIQFSGLAIDAFSRTPVNSVNISGKFTCNVKEEKY